MAIIGFNKLSKTQLAIGVLQFASSWIIIGYIWSLLWGILLFLPNKSAESQPLNPLAGPQGLICNIKHVL